MKEITKVVYRCDYCGLELEDIDSMFSHEEVCARNPQNMPCSCCKNQLLGYGCTKSVDMHAIGGNVKCFYYKEGIPASPGGILNLLFNNGSGGDNGGGSNS